MNVQKAKEPPVLALVIQARRIGYALFEGIQEPTVWGIQEFQDTSGCFNKACKLMEEHSPEAIVLPATDKRYSRLSQEVHKVVDYIAAAAAEHGIEVVRFTRDNVRACFSTYQATTKQEIATAVGEVVPVFARCVPRPRRMWEGEQHSMILFDALSLIVTFYQTERQQPDG